MSYAASSRSDFSKLCENEHYTLRKSVNDFDYIGVRDKLTYDAIKKELSDSNKIHMCCDPSFVYDFKKEKCLVTSLLKGIKDLDDKKKNIVVLTEDKDTAKRIRKNLASEYNLISVFEWHKGYINLEDVSPIEWIKLLEEADLVITSLFHGICFSIMNDTPFIAVPTRTKKDKIIDLLNSQRNLFTIVESENIGNDFSDIVDACIKKKIDYKKFKLSQEKLFTSFLVELNRLAVQNGIS